MAVTPSPGPYFVAPDRAEVWAANGTLVARCESALLTPEQNRVNAKHLAVLSTLPALVLRAEAILRARGVRPAQHGSQFEQLLHDLQRAVRELEVQP